MESFPIPLSPAFIALYAAGLMELLALVFFFGYFLKIGLSKPSVPEKLPFSPGVSVVVAARNEYKNLRENLPKLLEQDYPDFEVIVINDGSWDGTEDYLLEMEKQHSRLKVVTIDHDFVQARGKKFALTLGFKAATKDILLLTDADCMPASPLWIRGMVAPYMNKGTEIVLGFSPYRSTKGILGWFMRWETLYTAVQYIGMALRGNPYMGVGRNMSYTRDLFFRTKGFASHHHLVAGDDDLFVRDNATRGNTAVQFAEETIMYSTPRSGWSWRNWWLQKKRHNYIGRFYQPKHKRLLAALHTPHVLFYLLLITATVLFLVLEPGFWWLPPALLGFRWLCHMSVLGASYRKLGKNGSLVWSFPIWDPCFALYLVASGTSAYFSKHNNW